LAGSSMVGCKKWKEDRAILLYAGSPIYHYGGRATMLYGGGAMVYYGAAPYFCMGVGVRMIVARAAAAL
jgi:hypothetical protein